MCVCGLSRREDVTELKTKRWVFLCLVPLRLCTFSPTHELKLNLGWMLTHTYTRSVQCVSESIFFFKALRMDGTVSCPSLRSATRG